jgi:hypothetical protein
MKPKEKARIKINQYIPNITAVAIREKPLKGHL